MKRNKPTAEFGPPVVSTPGVNPVAEKYRQDMAGRYSTPVAGGPNPPIPRLDMPASQGMTMADQARVQQAPPPGAVPSAQAPAFIQPPSLQHVAAAAPPPPPATAKGPALLHTDILPEEVRQDPAYREGSGSMYAVNQPSLAMKYGVVRNGKRLMPQALMSGSTGQLSQQTVEQLRVVQEFQAKREQVESPSPNAEAEAAAAAGPAGAAARMGGGDTKPLSESEREDLKRAAESIDEFDYHTIREMMMRDVLNNEEQRKLIESRLQPMDVTDYIMKGYVEQDVRINKGLTITFRSVDGQTDLALKRLIIVEAKGFNVDDRYILDKYSMMGVACAVSRINNLVLPDYHDATGNFDEKLFWVKFNKIIRMGTHALASMGINYFWFDIRVRKLVAADTLGNG